MTWGGKVVAGRGGQRVGMDGGRREVVVGDGQRGYGKDDVQIGRSFEFEVCHRGVWQVGGTVPVEPPIKVFAGHVLAQGRVEVDVGGHGWSDLITEEQAKRSRTAPYIEEDPMYEAHIPGKA